LDIVDNETEGELDRISATRNRPYAITGLATRIGRFVIGNSYFLSDLFLHDDYQEKKYFSARTVWCWKTSLVRETARRLSEKQNAMIVDTSNEICGDSDVTHLCVGKARIMRWYH
jgi:stage III sporulation protein SpoIIIAA